MPSYGPWFQLPDVELSTGTDPVDIGPPGRPVYGIYQTSTDYKPEPIEVTPSHVQAFIAEVAAQMSTTGGIDTGPDLDQARWRSHHDSGLVVGGPDTTYLDSHHFERGVYGEKRSLTLAQVQWDDDWLFGSSGVTFPDGLVGFEVETRAVGGVEMAAGVPVAADIAIFAGVSVGVAANAEIAPIDLVVQVGEDLEPDDWNLAYAVDPTTARATAALEVSNPQGESLTSTLHIDLANDQEDLPGEWAVLPLWAAVRARPGATAFLYAPDDDFPIHDLTISADVAYDVTYVIRPPRIRWIFDTPPYRRTYPRDDALAGGAGRTWPPSKAVQSSRRTLGGYL